MTPVSTEEPMIVHSAPSTSGATAVYVGTVWVVARHLLVSQALSAALARRVADVRPLVWGPNALDRARIDPSADVLLVVDDLDSPAAIASVRALVAGASFRSLVMTKRPKGPVWGALLVAGVTEVTGEPESIDEVSEIIEHLCAGLQVLPERERAELCEAWERHVAEEEQLLDRMATLSPRELIVLQSLASGSRSEEIAETLRVAQSTVRSHIRSIRRKLGVDSQLRAMLVVHRLASRIPSSPLDLPAPRRPEE